MLTTVFRALPVCCGTTATATTTTKQRLLNTRYLITFMTNTSPAMRLSPEQLKHFRFLCSDAVTLALHCRRNREPGCFSAPQSRWESRSAETTHRTEGCDREIRPLAFESP